MKHTPWLAIVACCACLHLACALVTGKDHLAPKQLVLSFDDGPNNTTTPLLLRALREHGVRATFFVVGANLDNPALLRHMLRDGHVLGSHTFGHVHLASVSAERMHEEVTRTEQRFMRLTGDRPWFFRAPYGELNTEVANYLTGRGYQIVGWDDDTFDWQKSQPDEVASAALRLLQGHTSGAIMLMHEYPWTSKAQKTLLPQIAAAGWRFADPLDMLSAPQLDALRNASCGPDVCARYALTRRWCCARAPPPGVAAPVVDDQLNATALQDALEGQRRGAEAGADVAVEF